MSFKNAPALGLAMALAALTWACGSDSSPAGPSPASLTTATVRGTVNARPASASSLGHALGGSSAGSDIRVSVVGTSLATTTDGSGRFALSGVPSGTVTLRFEGPGIDARLQLSGLAPGQVLTIDVQASGARAELVAPSASPSPSPSPSPGPEDDVEFRGTVESVTPPSLVVTGRTVVTDAGTRILDRDNQPIGLSDIPVGSLVEVEGSAQADGSVLASKIKLEDDDANEDDDNEEVEFTGVVGSITPPTLVVDGRTVLTDASTEFRGKGDVHSLSDLAVGMTVEVKGQGLADGSVLARRIKVEDDGDDDSDDDHGDDGEDDGGDGDEDEDDGDDDEDSSGPGN